jgi:hypothetical protein
MIKNPYLSGLFAISYIVSLVSSAILLPRALGGPEESILYPMLGLAVLVLSAATMAYLFFYQPVVFLLEGKRDAAVGHFFRTMITFAVATATLMAASIVLR